MEIAGIAIDETVDITDKVCPLSAPFFQSLSLQFAPFLNLI